MAINIDTLVHNDFGRSACDQLEKLTGKPAGQVKSGVERAITEVLDGFSFKARDEAGRQSVYEAARYCDDGLIDDPAVFFGAKDQRAALAESNAALGSLLGAGKRADIAAAVRSASDLSAEEADMVTGYVAPGVLGVMKRQMLNGAVLDNSDGIGQMLLGDVTTATVGGAGASVDHSVPKSAPRQTQTTHATTSTHAASANVASASAPAASGSAAAASVHESESDQSWLFRWAMPVLLLGGLVLAGVQNCGPKTAITAAETNAQKLMAAQTEVDGLSGQISALTAERDEALSGRETAVTEIGRLQGELDTASAVASDTSELDAANAEMASLKDQLAQASDTSELDAANAEVASLKDQLLNSADSGALNAEILSLKGQLANVPPPVDNSAEVAGLKQSVEDGELRIAQLESELGTVRDSRAELEESLAAITAEQITSENRTADLKEKLLAVAGTKNRMEGRLGIMQANLDRAVDDATAKRKELVASRGEHMKFTSESEAALDSEQSKRAALSKRLGNAIAFSKTRGEQLAAVQQQADAEQEKRMALSTRLNNAIAFSKSRGEQLEETDAKLAKVTKGRSAAIKTVTDLAGKLRAAEAATGEVETQLAAAQQETEAERAKRLALSTRLGNAIAFSKSRGEQLEETDAKLAKVTKGRSAAIKTVTDLAGKLRAAEAATGEVEAQLAVAQQGAEAERAKRQALSARLNNAIAFSKSRGDQLNSERSRRMTLSTRLDNAIAFSKDRAQQIDALTADRQSLESEVASLSSSLAGELAAAGLGNLTVSPVEDSQAVGITMGSSDLYGVGRASLSSQGVGLLGTVGSIVSQYDDEWRIDVEGHTDSQPIGGVLQRTYASNWELSTARAAAAVRYLESSVGIPSKNMSVRGFGEHKPVDTNDTAEGRLANRRIELILRKRN